jgi:UDP-GlcNAc:undecaprenyl-phosphate GlcNAc-1-phosphate transferase
MPIGFTLGACAMMASGSAQQGVWAAAAAILVVGLPAFDTALVIVSRRRRGAPVLTGSRDHITHRLHRRMRSERAVAAVLAGAQGLLGLWAVALITLDRPVDRILLCGVLACTALGGVLAYVHWVVRARVPVWDAAQPGVPDR